MSGGNPRVRGGQARTLVLAAASIGGIVICVLLAEPFLGAITWALALAILFAPFQSRVEGASAMPFVVETPWTSQFASVL